jgi:hypothetical protein
MESTQKLALLLFRLLAMALMIFVFSLPAMAYEEDTHFQMTYVICRSVGFTADEALIIAAVDQGMDDSAGTVANGGLGGVIPNVTEEWMWHALDRDGNMNVAGILAKRNQLYQAAFDEPLVRNKLIRFGVFFHYQQDTWAHRHHYKDFAARVTPAYDPNHLSRDGYTTYDTPFGHAKDGHAPDRPPFDPVAALMDLEDGVVFARQFLKQGLGRDPGAFLASYTPRGGQDDAGWTGSNKGAFFKQISLANVLPNDAARSYLLKLIRAQIDTYSVSGTRNPRYWPYYTPDEANLDQMRAALEKVCKDFESDRAPGISDPTIKIPNTIQKAAQGYTGLTTALLTGKLPDNPLLLVGVGMDGNLFTKLTLAGDWGKIPDSGFIISIDAMPDASLLGVGADNNLWTKATLGSPWVKVANSGSVLDVISMPDGTLLGVGTDQNLWTKATLTANWVKVPNSGAVIGVALMWDGTLLGVGADQNLWTKATLTANWVKVPNSGAVVDVIIMKDGTLLGVGADGNLWTKATMTGNWVKIANSGSVRSVTEMPLTK